ncbi:hypothetical protein CRYUN_Cryun05aG0250600 [Craigia yunnanensis]
MFFWCGDAGYQVLIECANALVTILQIRAEEVMIESTGVIGQRIKKEALLIMSFAIALYSRVLLMLTLFFLGFGGGWSLFYMLPHLYKGLVTDNLIPEVVYDDIFPLADSAAVAITTTNLISKSVAIEYVVGGTSIRVGGMTKGSGMIHPNMATILGVITTDALVESDVWRKMVQVAISRSFNQITVDGDTNTNYTVIAFASGLSG